MIEKDNWETDCPAYGVTMEELLSLDDYIMVIVTENKN